MTLVKLSFFKKKIFTFTVQIFLKDPLTGFYDSEPIIHVACIFSKHQTGAIADHCFEVVT